MTHQEKLKDLLSLIRSFRSKKLIFDMGEALGLSVDNQREVATKIKVAIQSKLSSGVGYSEESLADALNKLEFNSYNEQKYAWFLSGVMLQDIFGK